MAERTAWGRASALAAWLGTLPLISAAAGQWSTPPVAQVLKRAGSESARIIEVAGGLAIPDFAHWKRMWDAASPATGRAMLGTWRTIGMAASPQCARFQADSFNPEGFLSRSGSLPRLKFESAAGAGVAVRVLDLGWKGSIQGPYQFRNSAPQFVQWGYGPDGRGGLRQVNDLIITNVCRIAADDARLLLCAQQILLGPASKWEPAEMACTAHEPGTMAVYAKEE